MINPNYPKKHVDIYTDGACKGNPGPGGYGSILVYMSTEKRISKGYFSPSPENQAQMTIASKIKAKHKSCFAFCFSQRFVDFGFSFNFPIFC